MASQGCLVLKDLLEGRRAVLAALRADRVARVSLAEGAHHAIVEEIREEAKSRGVPVEEVPRVRLDAQSFTGKHQGVMAEVRSFRRRGWELELDTALEEGRVPFLLALDGVQDPGNLGALVRSAAAFGVDAVIIPEDRAAPVTEVTAKAAAGALEIVEVATVTSLQNAAERAKERGCWIVALAEEGAEDFSTCNLFTEPLFLIIGAEGRGVSRTLRALADALVKIPTMERFPTLNASAAGAIAMHEVRRARLAVP